MSKPSTSWIILDNVEIGDEFNDPVGHIETEEIGQQYAVSAAQAIARFKYKTGFREGDRVNPYITGRCWEIHTLSAVRESEYRKAGKA